MKFNVNPLDVLGKRSLKSIPVHFSKIKISNNELFEKNIVTWIETKLNGRYAINCLPDVDNHGKLKISTFVGFENQKELTYFLLACPHIRRN